MEEVPEDSGNGMVLPSQEDSSSSQQSLFKPSKRSRPSVPVGSPQKKKKRKSSWRRPSARVGYHIHEAEDMLLIVPNLEESAPRAHRKKACRLRKLARSKVCQPKCRQPRRVETPNSEDLSLGQGRQSPSQDSTTSGPGWGDHIPLEILVRIFQVLVASDGAVPFLCRAARVCRLWYDAASHSVLWQKVSLAPPWPPRSKGPPSKVEKRILSSLEWLVPNRFSLLRELSLSHWKNYVPLMLKAVSESCPHLTSLKLSHCQSVTAEALVTLPRACPQLDSLNLQNSQVEAAAVLGFLEAAGKQLRRLWLTYSSQMTSIISLLSNGCCPQLQLLEVDTGIKPNNQHFQLHIEALQAGCPQLQVLRLLNLVWSPKMGGRGVAMGPGFPDLEELCLATSTITYVSDEVLYRLLHRSPRLRVLDLRGCARLTPAGLSSLPCLDLEQLHLGLYGSVIWVALPKEGSPLITWKWHRTLQELDLNGQCYHEEDLRRALAAFSSTGNGYSPILRSLSLKGTQVTVATISSVISSCPDLSYLNLSSCRYLPRGLKKAYRGQAEIQWCLDQLLTTT
ncbi:F-box/LRR-repeat protein 6 [Dromiciops gliroides]|uniref:F-box/LRR-repeat protein 6 n=1 Tax=Dromiciops gliroides TaxID=33562 RepID=UPI001CC7BDB5|nr:F-box/LRR-repeat protein 6 [Dromiciops gliroides]XP_043832519.1 F-box/LRR-repeat protein 6 [Dromiciops gliroides]XP_043832522.1 F-box/LRR-repeat protein 6 [Dromiciops gliroides]